ACGDTQTEIKIEATDVAYAEPFHQAVCTQHEEAVTYVKPCSRIAVFCKRQACACFEALSFIAQRKADLVVPFNLVSIEIDPVEPCSPCIDFFYQAVVALQTGCCR